MSDQRYSVTGSGYSLDQKQQALIALAESLGPAFARRVVFLDSLPKNAMGKVQKFELKRVTTGF